MNTTLELVEFSISQALQELDPDYGLMLATLRELKELLRDARNQAVGCDNACRLPLCPLVEECPHGKGKRDTGQPQQQPFDMGAYHNMQDRVREHEYKTQDGVPATTCSKCGDWTVSDPCSYCQDSLESGVSR